MVRVSQQKHNKQAAATAPGNVRGAKVAKQRKKHKIVLESSNNDKDEDKLRVVVRKKKHDTGRGAYRGQLSFHMEPPPGYTFIPAGNTQLTAAMKAFAKRYNHKVMAVSATPHAARHELSREVHRVGYHFPTQVVDQVCSHYGIRLDSSGRLIGENDTKNLFMKITQKGEVVLKEKIRDQVTINTEAKEIIRDLFPTIPDNDLFQIIKTAFQLGDNKVGTAEEIPLVRRAQLAVVAHIRHVYTGYDKLLRQVPYNEARHMVEKTTLRKLVEWRGGDDDKDESQRRAVDDAVREVIVLSDEEESDSELEEGQVLENGDIRVDPLQKPALPALETQHRPLSPAEMTSEEDAPSGYRYVPLVTKRRPVVEPHLDAVARQQSRYAIWDQVRSEYRAGIPLEDPARVISRIPLDEPIHSPARSAYPPSEYRHREQVYTSEPTVRYVPHEEPRTARYIRQESPPIFRGADGKMYERVAPRIEEPPPRTFTPPTRVYASVPQYHSRRSASPRPLPPVYHRRTPSLNETDGTIMPSIEGADGSYTSPAMPRNPFESRHYNQTLSQRRVSDRFQESHTYVPMNLPANTEHIVRRQQHSRSPPFSYPRQENTNRDAHENTFIREHNRIPDSSLQSSIPSSMQQYRAGEMPPSVAHLSIRDQQSMQSPSVRVAPDNYHRVYAHNDQVFLTNRDSTRSYDAVPQTAENRRIYEPIEYPEHPPRQITSRNVSPSRYIMQQEQGSASSSSLQRYYVRGLPTSRNDIELLPSRIPNSHAPLEQVVPYVTYVSSQSRVIDEHILNNGHEPRSRTSYIYH